MTAIYSGRKGLISTRKGDKYSIWTPDVDCDKGKKLGCQSFCCRYWFALTRQDIKEGIAKWDSGHPFIIQRAQEYCIHFNMEKNGCSIYQNRPHVCRIYDCSGDERIQNIISPEKERKH